MTEVFLLGSWLGGALCYGAVLSAGDKPMGLLKVACCAAVWPVSIAIVYASWGES